MSNPKPTYKNDGWLLALYGLLLLAGLAMIVVGLLEMSRILDGTPLTLGMGLLAVIILAALYPIASSLSARAPSTNVDPQTLQLLQSINDRLLISDTAKRIAYREHDRDALRQAIREDIERRDYDAALVLVTEMAQQYGYRLEAEEFRDQILTARKVDQDQQVNRALAKLDDIIARNDWEAAAAEAAKLMRLYPDSSRIRLLDRYVKEARDKRKHELERAFLHASERDDVELAMETLKELDKYLTEAEAEPFRETARGVIGKKRMNLGVQFKLAVHDKDWTAAVRVGEQIIQTFPNSKMSDEVRNMIDLLRERAAGQQAARAQA